MKVLFDCLVPFALAHGGQQIQIQQTKAALEGIGVEVEYLRWWDDRQTGDLLHYFGRPPAHLTALAHERGLKVVAADLLSAQGSRPAYQRILQKLGTWLLESALPAGLLGSTGRACLTAADACISLTPWEGQLLETMYGVPRERIHVVPNGVEEEFLNSTPKNRGKWLVCTATITERKRVLELAEAAADARVPVWIIGRPYSEANPYVRRFNEFAKSASEYVRYEGAVRDRATMAKVYREARGFALLSAVESLSLSALEAAACGCPLLLSDLPWARSAFGESASYCKVPGGLASTSKSLKRFYERAPHLPTASKPLSWREVAQHLKQLYTSLLS